MTKYVVSGYIGFDNFGDEAIAHVLVDKLKSIGASEMKMPIKYKKFVNLMITKCA